MIRIPKEWRPKPCSCGSGKLWSPRYDARGIFLTYTCEACHDRKMAGYRPDVRTDPSYRSDEPIDDDCIRLASGPVHVLRGCILAGSS
jgi:hypothetical protein